MRKLTLLLLAVSFFYSCVPNKDLVYFQGKAMSKKDIHRLSNKPYRLQVNDNVIIDMKATDNRLVALFNKSQDPNSNQQIQPGLGYFNGYRVDTHGNIRVPYIGEINVLGYTTKEVRLKIEDELSKLFKNNQDYFVSVKLDGIRYTIFGEVAVPGPKVIYENKVSIIDAISNAGDITITGNRKKVEVLRSTPNGREKYTIDLTKMDAFDSDVFYIEPNDYINVLPLKQKSWGTGTTGLQSLTTIISIFTLVTSTILLVRGL